MTSQRNLGALAALALVSSAGAGHAGEGHPSAELQPRRPGAVADWNWIASRTVMAADEPLEVKLRAMAMVNVAMFEVLNFIEGRYTPLLVVRSSPLSGMSLDAAAAAAAHQVLVELYPDQKAALGEALKASLGELPDHPPVAGSVTTGRAIAAVVLALQPLEWKPMVAQLLASDDPSLVESARSQAPASMATADALAAASNAGALR